MVSAPSSAGKQRAGEPGEARQRSHDSGVSDQPGCIALTLIPGSPQRFWRWGEVRPGRVCCGHRPGSGGSPRWCTRGRRPAAPYRYIPPEETKTTRPSRRSRGDASVAGDRAEDVEAMVSS